MKGTYRLIRRGGHRKRGAHEEASGGGPQEVHKEVTRGPHEEGFGRRPRGQQEVLRGLQED